ncbi:MAG: hypothetical protein ACE10M_04985 [Alphaproteobacteria bacterium]
MAENDLPAAGEPAPGAEPGAERETEPSAGDWRAAITDEKARRFAERFTSPAEAAVSAFKARQQLSGSVRVPGRKAGREDVAAFRRALGVPDRPEGYAVALPEGLPGTGDLDEAGKARLDIYLKAMHESGATPDVVQRGIDLYYGFLAEGIEARERGAVEARETANAELTREWGADAKRNDACARRAFDTFGGERFAVFVENAEVGAVKLGDHPEMRRIFAAIGRAMGEDRLHAPGGGEHGKSAQERIDEIHSWQHSEDPKEREKYGSDAAQAELRGLYRRLEGDGPIVGAGGRTL